MRFQLVRNADWLEQLHAYFTEVETRPFEWGQHDCALFAATAIERMCGVDIAEDFRGRYSDREGAARALRDHGAGTLRKTFTDLIGPSKNPAQAKRGDVLLFQKSVGICCGSFGRFVGEIDEASQPLTDVTTPALSGLIYVPLADCTCAWTVGGPHG